MARLRRTCLHGPLTCFRPSLRLKLLIRSWSGLLISRCQQMRTQARLSSPGLMDRWLPASGRGRGEAIWLGLGMPDGLVFVGAEVAELAWDATGVVPRVDVFKDCVLGLVAAPPAGAVDQFDLQCGLKSSPSTRCRWPAPRRPGRPARPRRCRARTDLEATRARQVDQVADELPGLRVRQPPEGVVVVVGLVTGVVEGISLLCRTGHGASQVVRHRRGHCGPSCSVVPSTVQTRRARYRIRR